MYLSAAVLYGGLLGFGFFAPSAGIWSAHHYLMTSALLALTAVKLFRLSSKTVHTRRDTLEAGLLLLLCVHVPIQATGSLASPALPAMYLLVALLAAYSEPSMTALFVGLATALIVPGVTRGVPWSQWIYLVESLAVYAVTVAAFALVVGTFVSIERRRRLEAVSALNRFVSDADALAQEVDEPTMEAMKPALQAEQERRMREATRNLDESLFNVLETARGATGAYSVIYFRHDVPTDQLVIRQMMTASDHVVEHGLPARQASLVSGVLKTKSPVRLKVTRGRPLPYYTRQPKLDTAVAVPVYADEKQTALRGVLLADFTEECAEDLAELLAGFGRTITELERDARERELHAARAHRLAHYFDTSKQLTSTLALEEILGFAISASQELADFDFAVIVETDEEGKQFHIRKAEGRGVEKVVDKRGSVPSSLVGWVIKNRQYLPVPQFRRRAARTPLLGKRLDPDGIRSALIFPLARQDQTFSPSSTGAALRDHTVGAFVIGSCSRDEFEPGEVQVLEGIANQTALAMANAILYSRMQEMATTDGLTGLANHRYFQEALTKELERAQRSKQQVALILMDVDHFKSVNDNFGHPVGDVVLKKVAEILKNTLQRTIDLPARYGGEEFVTLLPDTDAKGARRVADKIRAALAKERFDGGDRKFQVTLSAGIAVYPGDGDHKQTIIDHADKALYHSKETGRNRSTLWSDVPAEPVVAVRTAAPALTPKETPR